MTLGERIGGFLDAETETLELARLDEATTSVLEMREALHEKFRALPSEAPLAVSILAQALAARLVSDRTPRITRLLDEIFAQYAAEGGVKSDGRGSWTLSPEALAESYQRRWQKLRATAGDQIDLWFGNYARHYVFHEWYCDVPTLGLYVQTLALKLALIRFLVAGHPSEDAGKALVEVVYTLARAIDHSVQFVEALAKVMREKLGPAATVALLKL
jgi:hypothetical protein